MADQGRYGQGKRFNPLVVLLVVLLHAGLFALINHLGPSFAASKAAKVFTVNLIPAPPPPAPAETPPPPPSKPELVVPRPEIDVPRIDPPIVMATPEIPLAPVVIASAPVPARQAVASAPVPAPSITDGGDLGTQMVAGKPPRYPIESRRKREQGTVLLALTVGLDGCVENIRIARSSGFDRLDKAALDAVKRWRWRPTLRNGEPVLVKGVVEIPFVLQTQDHA